MNYRRAARAWTLIVAFVVLTAPRLRAEDRDTITELQRSIDTLRKQNEALQERVRVLEQLASRAIAVSTISINVDGKAPPIGYLEGIRLPDAPTKSQVRIYVAKVLRAATRNRTLYDAADPEVDLLKKTGADHVDVLLEPLLYEDRSPTDIYLIEALKAVAREKDKPLVMEYLPLVRDLVQVVLIRDWTEEAAPTLLAALKDRESWLPPGGNLPPEWIEAVVELNRPGYDADLRTYFVDGPNRYRTWRAIGRLKRIDLTTEIEELWHTREGDGIDQATDVKRWQIVDLAAVAAHYGHLDALAVLFHEVLTWPAWEVITELTPYDGTAEDAEVWFVRHKEALVFDSTEGRYRLRDGHVK